MANLINIRSAKWTANDLQVIAYNIAIGGARGVPTTFLVNLHHCSLSSILKFFTLTTQSAADITDNERCHVLKYMDLAMNPVLGNLPPMISLCSFSG